MIHIMLVLIPQQGSLTYQYLTIVVYRSAHIKPVAVLVMDIPPNIILLNFPVFPNVPVHHSGHPTRMVFILLLALVAADVLGGVPAAVLIGRQGLSW